MTGFDMTMEEKIREKLEKALSIEHLVIKNQSHLHAGHSGDDGSGESHFMLEIQSPDLDSYNRVNAQRRIHDILSDEVTKIHALAIKIIRS